ncbi:MarR family transcriptional regulator [Sporolactobacillus shoreicorticis]|uniref:MarR family winged helix-turn-helix transcriptional regulator n=1 Tax=Sporolactobacillus shoreicorticis TaxID=1923877 RepID=A0ABW5S021_9BACL|nr:MarR family transcriptional regulator [Sporolactobacillus shoreicorticis]MCO7127267.1 MarR family transcriptional regulator [Sporolactobacillus shoreicorticis]
MIFVRRYKRAMNELRDSPLTGHEFSFLSYLYKHHRETASKIAKKFEVSPSYATTVIDKLIRCGYVARKRSETDRRVIRLTVTDEGIILYRQLSDIRRAYLHKVFQEFDDAELEQLSNLIAKLIQ